VAGAATGGGTVAVQAAAKATRQAADAAGDAMEGR
jgi:hypothetical protein